MPSARDVTKLLVGEARSTSLLSRRRAVRWQRLTNEFPDLADMRVLDLGGRPAFWLSHDVHPTSVVCLNVEPPRSTQDAPWLTVVEGDACQPPDSIGRGFDLVFSNSVIEHVGGRVNRTRFAETVHTMADRHWVQTPYRYFPIEPHWLFPGMQFLPLPLRTLVVRHWPLGWLHSKDPLEAIDKALSVELLGVTEMRELFPSSRLWRERFVGLVKSVVAIR
jgi:hypothetical protein